MITFQGGQTLPTQGTDAYKALSSSSLSGAGSFNPASKEVSVVSTQGGQKVLNQAVDKHNGDMTSITPVDASKTTTEAPKPAKASDASISGVKAQGGITADEAQATGVNSDKLASDYSYDTNTGYYIPKDQNAVQARNDYKADVDKTNSAFSTQIAGMDSATQKIIDSLKLIYDDRITAQQDVNKRELQGFNTMNIRGGTSRYAGGVAQSILTADENEGLKRIQVIANEQASKMAEAQQNLTDKKYTAFLANRQEVDKLTADYKNTIKDLQDKAIAEKNRLTDEADKTRQYNLDVEKFNQSKDEASFDRAFKTEQLKFEEKNKNETLSLERFKAGMGVGAPNAITGSASMGADNKPDPMSQKQVLDEITAKYGPMTATAVKGLTDYSRLPSDFPTRVTKGTGQMDRATAVSLAQQYDPTYTEAGAPARQSYMKSLASGPIYNATISANKAINHLIAFTDTVSKLGNSETTKASNAINQTITAPFSTDMKRNIASADTEASGLKDELAKFFKGTGTTDVESIKTWGSQLSRYNTPEQQKGLVQGAINLLAGQIDVMNQSYTATMGKAPEGAILQPATIAKLSDLKNKGFVVDIPGVNYTDPIAYQKSPNFDADSWNEARKMFPDYTPQQILQIIQ